jgi:hypothetical protein
LGKERPGRDADPSPPSSAVGHERVELYLYCLYGPYGLYRASVELYLYSPYGLYGLYRASVELYLYSPYGPYGLYRASVELYLYSPYGPYGLYRTSVELYLYSPYGPYGLYRALVPVQGCTLPLLFTRLAMNGVSYPFNVSNHIVSGSILFIR